MPADFVPSLKPYSGQGKFRFWCQKVLPLVYDDSLSYYELLNKVVNYLNTTIQDVSDAEDNIVELRDAFESLQTYVNERLDNFDGQVEEIVDEMIEEGKFIPIFINALGSIIAPKYNTETYYTPQNYVIYNGELYNCIENTVGEWNSTKWHKTLVSEQLAERVVILPEHTGATDIDSVIQYLTSVYWLYVKKPNEIATCVFHHDDSSATGYFDTYSFTVLCKFSSNDAGAGLMISNSPKFCCAFNYTSPVANIYPLGNLGAENIQYNKANTYSDNTVGKALDNRIVLLPSITGLGDINSVISNLLPVYWANVKKANDIAICNYVPQQGDSSGYFGSASFGIICKFSSNEFGSGIMFSDSEKYACFFRVSAGTATIYPCGSLTANNIPFNYADSYDNTSIGYALKLLNNSFNERFVSGSASAINMNDFTTGLKTFNTGATNAPISGYGVLLGFAGQNGTWKFQIAFYTNGRIFNRINTGNWEAWYEVTRTAV